MARIGAPAKRMPGRDGFGDLLEARAPWGDEDEPGILTARASTLIIELGHIFDIMKRNQK